MKTWLLALVTSLLAFVNDPQPPVKPPEVHRPCAVMTSWLPSSTDCGSEASGCVGAVDFWVTPLSSSCDTGCTARVDVTSTTYCPFKSMTPMSSMQDTSSSCGAPPKWIILRCPMTGSILVWLYVGCRQCD